MRNADSVDSYSFDLPEHLIAQEPAVPRDSSRLLVLDRYKGSLAHHHFRDLPQILGERLGQGILVANNSKVIRARLLGRRLHSDGQLGGGVECLLVEELSPRVWECLLHAAPKKKMGMRFGVGVQVMGEVISTPFESGAGTFQVRFEGDPLKDARGELPLPPYMRRKANQEDETSYQTIYASEEGSVAAPTAGLHFTPAVHRGLEDRGWHWKEVTLHVGIGTFRPVKVDRLSDHVMHEERYCVPSGVAQGLTQARARGVAVGAVGTTSLRTLESVYRDGKYEAGEGRTGIFIHPGVEVRSVDFLLTNFHLPRSTLLMLVCAFAGVEATLEAYQVAVAKGYRFYSYGDAMLIL